MSAWPQAAWIVKKLQKNFDFSEQITYYTQNLTALNNRVNNLNDIIQNNQDTISILNQRIENIKQQTYLMNSAIRAKKSTNNLPEGYDSTQYSVGTIWLILK